MIKHITIFLLAAVLLLSCGTGNYNFSEGETAVLSKIDFDKKTASSLKSIVRSEFSKSETFIYQYNDQTDSYDEQVQLNNAIVFSIMPEDYYDLIVGHYDEYKSKGYLIFRSEMNFGYSDDGKDKVTILHTDDQFDILRIMATDGANYGLSNEDVVNKTIEWNSSFPFEIVGAGLDWMEAVFVTSPNDMMGFAEEIYSFCPDIVDQGTGTVEALAEEMTNSNSIYLWWD